MTKPVSLELNVKDNSIHCIHCKSRIENFLGDQPGIIRIKANQKTQQVHIIFNEEKISTQQIKGLLENMGFPIM